MNVVAKMTNIIEKWMGKHPILIKLYGLYYNDVVEKEIKLGQIQSVDHVLCIGGGCLPYTAIKIAQETRATIKVIDIDEEAVQTARRVVAKVGLSDRIKITLASGQGVDAAGFSVAHVALQATPHDEILENIFKTASTRIRILLRSPRKPMQSLYCTTHEKYLCNCCKQIGQNTPTMQATWLLTQ